MGRAVEGACAGQGGEGSDGEGGVGGIEDGGDGGLLGQGREVGVSGAEREAVTGLVAESRFEALGAVGEGLREGGEACGLELVGELGVEIAGLEGELAGEDGLVDRGFERAGAGWSGGGGGSRFGEGGFSGAGGEGEMERCAAESAGAGADRGVGEAEARGAGEAEGWAVVEEAGGVVEEAVAELAGQGEGGGEVVALERGFLGGDDVCGAFVLVADGEERDEPGLEGAVGLEVELVAVGDVIGAGRERREGCYAGGAVAVGSGDGDREAGGGLGEELEIGSLAGESVAEEVVPVPCCAGFEGEGGVGVGGGELAGGGQAVEIEGRASEAEAERSRRAVARRLVAAEMW